MTNPTFEQIYGTGAADVGNALTLLGITIGQQPDARLGVQKILSRLVERNNALIALGVKLKTYSTQVSIDNIDINTQRHTFTIMIDMAISANSTENEAGIPF